MLFHIKLINKQNGNNKLVVPIVPLGKKKQQGNGQVANRTRTNPNRKKRKRQYDREGDAGSEDLENTGSPKHREILRNL